jgi:hypothetical protein
MLTSVMSTAFETSGTGEVLDKGAWGVLEGAWMRLEEDEVEEEDDEGLFLGMATGVLALDERGDWFYVW